MREDVTFKDLLLCLANPIYSDKKSMNYTYVYDRKEINLIIERTDLTEVLLFKIIIKSSPNNIDSGDLKTYVFQFVISHGRIAVEINEFPFDSISIGDRITDFKHILDKALLDTNDNDGIIQAIISMTNHFQSRCDTETNKEENPSVENSSNNATWKDDKYLKLEGKINDLLKTAEELDIPCLVLTDMESYNYDVESSYVLEHSEKSYHEWVKKEDCTDLNFIEMFYEVKRRYYDPSDPQQRHMMDLAERDDDFTDTIIFDVNKENDIISTIRFYEINPKTFSPVRIMKIRCYDLIKDHPENSVITICPVSEAAGGDLAEQTKFISGATLVNDDSEHPWYEEFNVDGSMNNFIKQLLNFVDCI